MTVGRWYWLFISSNLSILSNTDFFSCLRQHCPLVVPTNWLALTSLSILAVAWLRLNIDWRSETEQELLFDSKTDFLPWEVLFDSLRSATLNPCILQSLTAKLLGISSCGEDKEVLILAQQIISFFNSLRIFFRCCTCRYQFNVVTALLYRVLKSLSNW